MNELYENIYGKRWSFGKNWKKFLSGLDENKIKIAGESLKNFIETDTFKGRTFLDIGCGSGLFSLGAAMLGAEKIVSTDIDDSCICCAEHLREKFGISAGRWEIRKGSVLDSGFMQSLPASDIVYAWGVLHHTGELYKALDNSIIPLKNKGFVYTAVYNEYKGFPGSALWLKIKKFYSASPRAVRELIKAVFIIQIFIIKLIKFKNPFKYVAEYGHCTGRGMDFFRDVEDWLGGYPYEFAPPERVISHYQKKGLGLIKCLKAKSTGCNEYLFKA